MDQTNMKVAYVVTQRGDKSFWNRVGVAFTNRDGSLNVKLDALPLGGTLQIRDWEPPRDEEPLAGGRARAPRREAPAQG